MATFSSYPASQVRAPDVWGAMQRGAEGAQLNQLRDIKIQNAMGEVQRQGQLREIMPGVGAEAGLGVSAQKALAIDPSQLANLMKIPKAKRDRAKEQAATLGNLALGVLTAPPIQRTAMWRQARESAIAGGANPQNVPEVYDQGTEQKLRQWVAQAGQIKTLLDQVPDTPAGYRGAGDGLEFIPGGPADPSQAGRLAAAKRSGEGEGSVKGLSVPESYNAILEEKTYLDAGQKPPRNVSNRAAVARHVLNTKRYTRDDQGNIMSFVPGVPQGYRGQQNLTAPAQPTAAITPAPAPPGQPVALTPLSRRGLTLEKSAAPKVDVSLPVSTIRKISELLNDPDGETITGVVGTAKRLGGGLARQAGIPVSARAERLQRLLETLQGQMGPIILNEKRLSETERARLERIVGNVSPTMDERALREALADLVDFIVSVEAR